MCGVEDYKGVTIMQLTTFLKFDEKTDLTVETKRITGGGTAQVSVDYTYILVDNI